MHYDMLQKVIAKLFELPLIKGGASFVLTFAAFMVGNIYNAEIIAVAMLMVIDAVTGVGATLIEKKAVTSRRFAHSVVKALVYFLAISAGKFLDTSVPGDLVQYSTIGFVAVTEFISILENIGRMGFRTPQIVLNSLKEKYHLTEPKK